MMYRCGWAEKEGQETVLAVEISRAGFLRALRHASLSHYDARAHAGQEAWRRALRTAPARVQWDPERDLLLRPLPHRSLQLGLAGEAAGRYADTWLVSVTDVTDRAREIHRLVRGGHGAAARELLPAERPYDVPEELLAPLRPGGGRPGHGSPAVADGAGPDTASSDA